MTELVDEFKTTDKWPGIPSWSVRITTATQFGIGGKIVPSCVDIRLREHGRDQPTVVHLDAEDARRLATAILECVMRGET